MRRQRGPAKERGAWSEDKATSDDRPHGLDPLVAYRDAPVIEVHGGVAMSGNEAQLGAQRELAIEHTMFIGDARVPNLRIVGDERHAFVERHRLEARIDDRVPA